MLILSRKKDETILIGENIKITIIDFHKNQVRIGIEAPNNLTILREELLLAVCEENETAVNIDVNVLEQMSKLVNHGDKKLKTSRTIEINKDSDV